MAKQYPEHTTDPKEYKFDYEEVQTILDAIQHWVFIKNRDGQYLLSNEKQAQEAYGVEPSDLHGMTDIELIDDDLDEEEEEKIRADDVRVMENGEKLTVPQEQFTGPDGTEYILRTTKWPFETDITDQDAMVGVAVDISNHVNSEKLVQIHETTQELIQAETAEEVANIAREAFTEVLGLDYCTLWLTTGEEKLELFKWSERVEETSSVTDLSTVTARPGDRQWDKHSQRHTAVETKISEEIDPADLPIDEPLSSLIALPIGEHGLVEVGSFEKDIFKDDLAKIITSSIETAFGRLQRERELEQLAEQVDETVTDVVRSTDEVTEMSENIDKQTSEQVDTMKATAAEVSTMSGNIEEVAAMSDQVESRTSTAAELADEGHAEAKDTKEVMEKVVESAETVTESVDDLQSKVDEINEIVEIINGISNQTNILAINASIEAARADTKGDGFAVVANEVKELAGESKENAAEIENLVQGIQQHTDETVSDLEEMITVIERGSNQVEEVMMKLEEISESVDDALAGIQDVATTTDEQATSTEEVASQVDKAVTLSENVDEQIEAVAQANKEITIQVSELRDSIARLVESR